jgi:uncharacterized protein (TIGR02996 family)
MDERRALMAAIIANPDEDTPRLAFADWLQEHGDKHDRARAEFIRLQIEAFPLPKGDESRAKLEKQAAALAKKYAKHWLGPIAGLLNETRFQPELIFDRGLLISVFLTPGAFLKPATQQALVEWLPLVGVKVLMLSGKSKKIGLVAESPVLGLVPALMWFDTQMDDAGLKEFAKSPHTSRLTTLNLEKMLATDTGLKALAKSPGFAGLRKLRILQPVRGGEKITAKGIRALIASDTLPRLDTFTLTSTWHVKMPAFCNEPALARLKRLTFAYLSESSAPLCLCPHLTGLEELTLHFVGEGTLTESDIRALLDNPALANLKRLTLGGWYNDHHPGEKLAARLRDRFGDAYSNELDYWYD